MKINEKTNITLSLASLISVVLFIIGFGIYAASWKTSIDKEIEKIVKIEQIQIEQRKEQTEQRNIIIEMKTDIKWIRKSVEKLLGQNNE